MSKYFIFVVDGEVAGGIKTPMHVTPDDKVQPISEKFVAIMSSDPKIIPSEVSIPEGWMWDGEKFYDPLESGS
jgi:hypothetical protein